MRLLKNKRGSPVFMFIIVIAALAALIMVWGVLSKNYSMNQEIGKKQMLLFDVYQHGEEMLFFIDQSGRYAAYQTLHELADNGGTLSAECGERNGYLLWKTPDQECFPSEKELNESFEVLFNRRLNDILKEFPERGLANTYAVKLVHDDFLKILAYPNLQYDLVVMEDGKMSIEYGSTVEYEEPEEEVPIQPVGDSKCSFVAEYAQQYLGCLYADQIIAGSRSTPETCKVHGLTCAGFVSAVIWNTLNVYISGNGDSKCEDEDVEKIPKDVKELRPGDIFSSSYLGLPGGHTGIYIGRGHVSEPILGWSEGWGYKAFTPEENGEYVFMHSLGRGEKDLPGVCYITYTNLLAMGYSIKSFCRPKACYEKNDL